MAPVLSAEPATRHSVLIKERGLSPRQGQNHPSTTTCLSPQSACPLWTCRMFRPPSAQGPLSASLQGPSLALCSSSPQGWLGCLLQWFRLWQAGPLSLSLCPYQYATAGPGARPHPLNYCLRRTQYSLLCADRGTFMARVQS